jgi:hypothetical protein
MNAEHDPLAADPTPLPSPQDQCKDCQRFFPGVQLIPLAHGNVCHDCHQQRQDTVMPADAFDKTTPPTAGLAAHLWDLGVAMGRAAQEQNHHTP